MRSKFKIIGLLIVSAVMGYFIGSAAFLMQFPDEIRLTEFNTHELNIRLPLSATFHNLPQYETVAVAKVNHQPICENTRLSLQQPLTIQTDSSGLAEMTIGAFGVPIRRILLDVVPEVEVIPLGMAIGVRINTDGIMVLGTGSFQGEDGEAHSPADGQLMAGDLIFLVNGQPVKNKEILSLMVAESEGDVIFYLRRDDEEMEIVITPQVASADDVRRIGAWVRDSTKGIGTITYFNPRTGVFGALGHGIIDVDTRQMMSVKDGFIMPSTVTDVQRGARGLPGELEGDVDTRYVIGEIVVNSPSGIYGTLTDTMRKELADKTPVPIALRSHIMEGPATILTTVSGQNVQEYEIYIENVNRFADDDTKGMIIRITDPALLKKTGGIVQGMSGSPILQNGRIIGAVTHVFVQDPTKGYGIFIESMMEQEALVTFGGIAV